MNILIIDDDLGIRETLGIALETRDHTVRTVTNREAAEKRLKAESFEVAFLDLRLGAESGLDLLPDLLRLSPRLAVIIMTSYASIETAVQAMQRGAADYLAKPFRPSQIEQVLERVMRTRQLEVRITDLEAQIRPGNVVEIANTVDADMQKLMAIGKKSAASNASILITGESGTGKSVLARQLHKWSARSREPFITVSCPSLSRDLFESELFGHVKGAFTGAVSHTWGKVAAADRGTLFLDEIGELPAEIQPKLLRLLQEQEYERLGESKLYRADVRIIAATNRDLRKEVEKGTFREDLWYRLEVMPLRMPSLRDRPGDILAIAESHLSQTRKQSGHNVMGFTEAAKEALIRYKWPGNIRELRNVVERASILASGEMIGTDELPVTMIDNSTKQPVLGGDFSVEEIEAEHVKRVLSRKATLQDAATVLQMDRKTLLRRRKELNLE